MLTKENILRRKTLLKNRGFVLHKGETNGHSFMVIVTVNSSNPKTGNMAQVWIMLENVNPLDGVAEKIDASTICKGCIFASGNGCYVNLGQAPNAIYKSYHKGLYPELAPKDYPLIFWGKRVRFGAYGNPSLIPLSKVKAIAAASSGWTGYFHDWEDMHPSTRKAYGKYFMASTETARRYECAKKFSLRPFHVSTIKPKDAIECLNTSHAMTCEQCRLCSGTSKGGGSRTMPNVWIAPHGGAGKSKRAALAADA